MYRKEIFNGIFKGHVTGSVAIQRGLPYIVPLGISIVHIAWFGKLFGNSMYYVYCAYNEYYTYKKGAD